MRQAAEVQENRGARRGAVVEGADRENVAITFLAMLGLTAVVAGVALGTLTSGGLMASLAPARAVGWAVAALVAVAGVWAITVRWRGRSLEAIGLARTSLGLRQFALGVAIGVGAEAVAVGLGAIGGLRLGSGPGVGQPSVWRYAVGVLAFLCSSILQDVLLVSGMMVCLETRLPRWAAIAIPSVIFAALHLGMPNGTVIGVLTTADFGVAFAVLFYYGTARRSLAMPIGLHTAWNVTIAIVLGLPLSGEASSWSFVRHEGGDQLWSGGAYGPEGGLGGLIAIMLVIAVALVLRARNPGYAEH
jgi:CAAX protease family protein